MDSSVDLSALTPSKTKLARAFAKVRNVRALTGLGPKSKPKSHEKPVETELKPGPLDDNLSRFFDGHDEKQNRLAAEAFLAKLFASVSAIKAAYAQLQSAQTPCDPEGIQSADQTVVAELKKLSELKWVYMKKRFDEAKPEMTLVLAEIEELNSLVKIYEITTKKLDSEVKLKDSEIIFLKEKLEEANRENKLIEKRLNSSGLLSGLDSLQLQGLSPTHFVAVLRQTVKQIRSFVRSMIGEMDSAGWDLELAAISIQPGVVFLNPNHMCFAFESFVCQEMFDGFNFPNFSARNSGPVSGPNDRKERRRVFFERFMELKSMKTKEYLDWKPKSTFARFCRKKYLRLVHPKMEMSLSGNSSQRDMVNSGERLPETAFFAGFAEMAKRVWQLHCLAFSFDPEVSIFRVSRGCRFSEVFMESLDDDAFLSPENDPPVAFTVVPGFKIGKTVIQCQVYLC